MNVSVCHSHHRDRCGVREYGTALDASFVRLGVRVRPHSYDDTSYILPELEPGDVVLVHYEPGLVRPEYLNHYLKLIKERAAKVVFCCHWYDHEHMAVYEPFVDKFVLHRAYAPVGSKTAVIPLGCPLYTPKAQRELRRRFALPVGATVMTTLGFLNRHKYIPELIGEILAAMAGHESLFLHVHTPWPFDDRDAKTEEPKIRDLVERSSLRGRVLFSTRFLPPEETLDIARAADLGFLFHGFHTGSVSAATKQFVAARRPLIVTGSTHAMDLAAGLVRVGFDLKEFAEAVVDLALDRDRLAVLGREMESEYERLNMDAVARRYLDLFAGLGVA